MKQALEALWKAVDLSYSEYAQNEYYKPAIAALKEAIKQQGEPVAWHIPGTTEVTKVLGCSDEYEPLYTAAPSIPEGWQLVNSQGLVEAMAMFVPHDCYAEMEAILSVAPKYKGEEQ